MPGEFKNNPLYVDITKLDHLSPQPTFSYRWNSVSGRWEPIQALDLTDTNNLLSGISGELSNIHVDVEIDSDTETHRLLSGISGELSNIHVDVEIDSDTETHRLLSGISGELSNIHVDVEIDSDKDTHRLLSGISGELSNVESKDTETHKLLSGISGELSNIHVDVEIDSDKDTHRLLSGISGELSKVESKDTETHRLLSGISGELSNIHVDVELDSDTLTHELLSGLNTKLDSIKGEVGITGGDLHVSRKDTQPWKLRTKIVKQKIEEDFILLENIPEHVRFGLDTGDCYGKNKNLMDDVYGTYFRNGRMNHSEQETGHPDYFIHAEYTDTGRCVDSFSTFHSDSQFSIRQENIGASLINSYELEDYNSLYERGLVDHVVLYNESSLPIQFHTSNRRLNKNQPVSPKTTDIMYLDSDMAVKIDNDEAGRIFVKRPHTISGYNIKYSIVYKVPTDNDIIE